MFNELDRYTLSPMDAYWGCEETKFEYWLLVELAVIDAYVVLGRLDPEGAKLIRQYARFNLIRMKELEAKFGHDMIAFTETVRESLVGTPAERFAFWFHLEVTSYNIEDPALILRLRQSTEVVIGAAKNLQMVLRGRAEECQNMPMIMCTHGQDAQPDTFGHILLVYVAQIERCWLRLQRSLDDDLKEGNISGAIGRYNEIDPEVERIALASLGLVPAKAETQILQRDRHAALMSHLSHLTSMIGQMCSTFWIMMHSGIRELQEPRKKDQRGSSAMPQKRNPILVEQLRGLARMLRGCAVIANENIDTFEGRDISQSLPERLIWPMGFCLTHYAIVRATGLVGNLVIFEQQMRENLEVRTQGTWASQRVRNSLERAGVEHNEAYEYVKNVAFVAIDQKTPMFELLCDSDYAVSIGGGKATALQIFGREVLAECFDVVSYLEQGAVALFGSKME